MANTNSAKKRMRQDLVRRSRNRARKSRLAGAVKKLRQAVEAGDKEQAQSLLAPTLGLIDRTAQRGTIHSNAAARRKSRLVRLVGTLDG